MTVPSMPLEIGQPSQVTGEYWLFAERKNGSYPAPTVNGGKWLIFIHRCEIDAWWATIKTATEQGSFGRSAKVSTAKPKPNVSGPSEHVICVYTYDCNDFDDVRRIRQALRDLGVA